MFDMLDPKARGRLERALAAGQKIEAIKIFREATGVGLAEAKAAVEAMQRPSGSESPVGYRADAESPASEAPKGHVAVTSSSGCVWLLVAGCGVILAALTL